MLSITSTAAQVLDSGGIDDIVAFSFDELDFDNTESPRRRWAKDEDPYLREFDGDGRDRRPKQRKRTSLEFELEDTRILPRSNGKPAHTNDILAYIGLSDGEKNAALRKYGNGIPVDGAPIVRTANEVLITLGVTEYMSGTPQQAREAFFRVADFINIVGPEVSNSLLTIAKTPHQSRMLYFDVMNMVGGMDNQTTASLTQRYSNQEVVAAVLNSYRKIGAAETESLLSRYNPDENFDVFVAVSDSIHRNGPEATYAVMERYGIDALPTIVNDVDKHLAHTIKPILGFDYTGDRGSIVPISTRDKRSKTDLPANHGKTQNHHHRDKAPLLGKLYSLSPGYKVH